MKAKDLMPKRYPQEKPSKEHNHLFHHIGLNKWFTGWWNGRYFQNSMENRKKLARDIDWFIDIPGAPDEVKPLAYPAHKPSEDGKYICHIKYWIVEGYALPLPEEWMIVGWDGDDWECVRKRVDYFIPIRLDEPVRDTNKLESEEDVSDEGVIWRDEHIKICSLLYWQHNRS